LLTRIYLNNDVRLKDRSLADQGLKFCFQDLIGRGTEDIKAYSKVEVRPLPKFFKPKNMGKLKPKKKKKKPENPKPRTCMIPYKNMPKPSLL